MTWDEYNLLGTDGYHLSDAYIETNIKCPICGRNMYFDNTVVLTSCPPQYKYMCKCGWRGFSYKCWIQAN